ncbi:DUF7521 family protein [Halorientalis salina]|uniref:DUF7521 family protein n=1 Tax=Halorientalis salina TaxID=2932266 RepID=UPI0020229E4A|nr:hypothetical protein [Halorientalis salina]
MTGIVPLVHVPSVIVALKTITLLLGGLIAYFSFKAYRRTGAKPLRLLAIGFGFVTAGSLIAGALDLVGTANIGPVLDRGYAIVAEAALTALGFAVIVYSLYAQQ